MQNAAVYTHDDWPCVCRSSGPFPPPPLPPPPPRDNFHAAVPRAAPSYGVMPGPNEGGFGSNPFGGPGYGRPSFAGGFPHEDPDIKADNMEE
eukprot:364187-Chlamydomonas_euryale.AAC.8